MYKVTWKIIICKISFAGKCGCYIIVEKIYIIAGKFVHSNNYVQLYSNCVTTGKHCNKNFVTNISYAS